MHRNITWVGNARKVVKALGQRLLRSLIPICDKGGRVSVDSEPANKCSWVMANRLEPYSGLVQL